MLAYVYGDFILASHILPVFDFLL